MRLCTDINPLDQKVPATDPSWSPTLVLHKIELLNKLFFLAISSVFIAIYGLESIVSMSKNLYVASKIRYILVLRENHKYEIKMADLNVMKIVVHSDQKRFLS